MNGILGLDFGPTLILFFLHAYYFIMLRWNLSYRQNTNFNNVIMWNLQQVTLKTFQKISMYI